MADELMKIAEESTRGGFYLITGTASATVIMAIASIIIARLLGPELYGQYTLALVTPQLLLLFTDLGVNQGIIKFTTTFRVKKAHSIRRVIKYGLMLRAMVGTLIFLLNYLLADFFAAALLQRPELAIYIRIAAISVLFQAVFTTIISAFVGLDKSEYNALTSNLQSLSKAAISLALVLLGFGVTGAVVGYVASYAIAAILGLGILTITTQENKDCLKLEDERITGNLKAMLYYGIPLYASALLAGFIPTYQNVVLAVFTTDSDIGNYKAAVNFISLMHIVTVPITTILLSAFSKIILSNHKEVAKKFYQLANKYVSLVIVPLTFLVMVLSKEIVKTIYGHAYEYAPLFLSIYCSVYFLVGFGYLILPSLYNGVGDTATTLKMNFITFLVLIFLSPTLTSAYKVSGLILAFITATASGNLYGLYTAKRRFDISTEIYTLLKIYVNSAISAVPIFLIPCFDQVPELLNVIIKGFLYLFTYATLTPITRTVKPYEMESAIDIIRKIQPLKLVVKPLLIYQQRISKFLERF